MFKIIFMSCTRYGQKHLDSGSMSRRYVNYTKNIVFQGSEISRSVPDGILLPAGTGFLSLSSNRLCGFNKIW